MSWNRVTDTDGRHNVTREWLHPSWSEGPTHSLMVGHTPAKRGQEAAAVMLSHKEPSGVRTNRSLVLAGDGKWRLTDGTGTGPEVSAPPEHIRRMIHNYHTQPEGAAAWMPLLDALAEEYPEHFGDHVEKHTASRASA